MATDSEMSERCLGTEIVRITFAFSASITETANRSFQKSFGLKEKLERMGETKLTTCGENCFRALLVLKRV